MTLLKTVRKQALSFSGAGAGVAFSIPITIRHIDVVDHLKSFVDILSDMSPRFHNILMHNPTLLQIAKDHMRLGILFQRSENETESNEIATQGERTRHELINHITELYNIHYPDGIQRTYVENEMDDD